MVAAETQDVDPRARIRDAALRAFATHGFKGASLRGIAEQAGVSLGMVQRQFPSKQALRAECDAYVLEVLQQARRRVFAADAASADAASDSVSLDPKTVLAPVVPYIAMVLLGDEATAARWFDELAELYGGVLTSGELGDVLPEDADREAIIAVYTAMQLGLTILVQQVYRRLDADAAEPSAVARIGRARLFLATERLVAPEVAARVRTELDRIEAAGAG